MNAAEIHNIVKDWPKEAWPENVYYDWNRHGPKRVKHFIHDDRYIDGVAELAFEGSGLRWLIDKAGEVYLADHSKTGGVARVTLGDTRLKCSRMYAGENMLAAIDAAIKGLST